LRSARLARQNGFRHAGPELDGKEPHVEVAHFKDLHPCTSGETAKTTFCEPGAMVIQSVVIRPQEPKRRYGCH